MSKPTKIYAEVLEQEALDQFNDAMAQPFALRGALMPDAHAGYSLPIGGVVETDGMLLPAWVGYDIGCGMCALQLEGIDKAAVEENAQAIFDYIYKVLPVGFNINQKPIPYSLDGLTEVGKQIAQDKKYTRALGSLGGGNHFAEIGFDENDEIWVVIHSGSRGVGHGIATHYMKLAHPEGKAKDGHFGFVLGSQEWTDYFRDMNWALEFALANRREIMTRIVDAITLACDISCYEVDFSGLINRNHNHAVLSGQGFDLTVIHRKGATHAEEGMLGVIPGNMHDGSFIVRGRGCAESLQSSSHGAGRILSRKKANATLSLEDFEKDMQGITAKVCQKTLDESRFAYKNIFEVMELQKDLVEVMYHIKPIINIKA